MTYTFYTFISVVIFALVHIFANKINRLDKLSQARFLSFGQGVAIAYVFIDLLPKLCLSDMLVKQAGIFPFLERHVFVMALAGFILFFVVDRVHSQINKNKKYWFSICSYALFNFFVGYAIVDKDNPEVQPLALFTFAMGLHYFANDYTLTKHYGKDYATTGKWILAASLFLGWFIGLMTELSEVAIALVSAFIGGGVMMNVIRHELPKENPKDLKAFLLSAFAYTLLLLLIGN